jgi:hypothetical protein
MNTGNLYRLTVHLCIRQFNTPELACTLRHDYWRKGGGFIADYAGPCANKIPSILVLLRLGIYTNAEKYI